MKKVAVLVDGGFYRKVAKHLQGDKTPEERVDELIRYCWLHLKDRDFYTKKGNKKIYQYNEMYRIFYYDCAPIDKTVTFLLNNWFYVSRDQNKKIGYNNSCFFDN